jgi:hypothetical protein
MSPGTASQSQSQSQSQLLYDWRFVANQSVSATNLVGPTTRIFIFQAKTFSYVLTRGWGCRLQLLLVLASAVILRSESRGPHYHIYCLRFKTHPKWRARSLYLYPLPTNKQGGPVIPPKHWVPFLSPFATRRAKVGRMCAMLDAHMWCKPKSDRRHCNQKLSFLEFQVV